MKLMMQQKAKTAIIPTLHENLNNTHNNNLSSRKKFTIFIYFDFQKNYDIP